MCKRETKKQRHCGKGSLELDGKASNALWEGGGLVAEARSGRQQVRRVSISGLMGKEQV